MTLTDGLAEALASDPRTKMWALVAEHFGSGMHCALPELSHAERHRARLDAEYDARWRGRYFDDTRARNQQGFLVLGAGGRG